MQSSDASTNNVSWEVERDMGWGSTGDVEENTASSDASISTQNAKSKCGICSMFLTTAIHCVIPTKEGQHSIFQSIALDLHTNKHLLLYYLILFFSLQTKCMCCDNRMEHRRPSSTNLFIFHTFFERHIIFLFTLL